MNNSAHRRHLVLEGSPQTTANLAVRLVEGLDSVLWVSGTEKPTTTPGVAAILPRALRKRLGQSVDAVVLDLHTELDANVIGMAPGFIWGGGALIFRVCPNRRNQSFWGRLGRRLDERLLTRFVTDDDLPTIRPERRAVGTDEQAALVAELTKALSGSPPTRFVVVADRGRGKSAGVGLTLKPSATPVVVTGPSPATVAEIIRWSGRGLTFTPVTELTAPDAPEAALIVVDEAAQLPVPVLRRLVTKHDGAHLVFATTVHGYEGTGRGFTLRFVDWLRTREAPVTVRQLRQPIRFPAEDPLEQAVFDALLLDAEPVARAHVSQPVHVVFDRDRLVGDEDALRQLFGLLARAHYRTTPRDLQTLLDSPSFEVHGLVADGDVVAANLVCTEPALPTSEAEAVAAGRQRAVGRALTDVIVAQLGRREAAGLTMVRSVRIATVPQLRRRGLASQLITSVEAHHDGADILGTLFGATPELIRFRRKLGYRLCRVSASRGSRSGELSVLMIRPSSSKAQQLVASMEAELARSLPRQWRSLLDDGETLSNPELYQALCDALPAAQTRPAVERRRIVRAYAEGPMTLHDARDALAEFVAECHHNLSSLPDSQRRLVEGLVVRERPWRAVAGDLELSGHRETMRMCRKALRRLWHMEKPPGAT